MTFDRIVTFAPAFDRRHSDPKKNYGIHGVELRMVLRGPLGATQFLLYTNWMLPHVTAETDRRILAKARAGSSLPPIKSIKAATSEGLEQALEIAERFIGGRGRDGLDQIDLRCSYHPSPADRGYHWSTPQYEGQEARDCDLLPGGKCYYDGSGLNAEQTYHALLEKGDAGAWADLESYYNELAARPTPESEAKP